MDTGYVWGVQKCSNASEGKSSDANEGKSSNTNGGESSNGSEVEYNKVFKWD